MSGWKFRLAEPADAEAFAHWTTENPQIDPKDAWSGLNRTNPTVLTFVAEHDGKAVAFAPIYLSAVLAHLAFNPEARASEKMQALDVLKDEPWAFWCSTEFARFKRCRSLNMVLQNGRWHTGLSRTLGRYFGLMSIRRWFIHETFGYKSKKARVSRNFSH